LISEGGEIMTPTAQLRSFGQSLWLDNITRDLLNSGTLKRYIADLSITGLTSNPTIFDHAIKNSSSYDAAITEGSRKGKSGESLFFDLALDDITQAADLFRPIHNQTSGVDGWASLEVPPSLAYDATKTLSAAKELFARAGRPNVFIKIPGTKEGLQAIEDAIFAGVPINVTLLFSADQYKAAAYAYLRGVERRIEAGLNPVVASVASVFISRWDVAVTDKIPESLRGKLGVTIARRVYTEYQNLLNSGRWQRALNFGARAQRLLWASTGTKDPKLPDTFYIKQLTAPFTINTMPEGTLKAFGDQGDFNPATIEWSNVDGAIQRFVDAGVDVDALGAKLQSDGAEAFVKSWNDLMDVISARGAELARVG
jgi:transaldolase